MISSGNTAEKGLEGLRRPPRPTLLDVRAIAADWWECKLHDEGDDEDDCSEKSVVRMGCILKRFGRI